jgi:hypothetical protein
MSAGESVIHCLALKYIYFTYFSVSFVFPVVIVVLFGRVNDKSGSHIDPKGFSGAP